MLFEALLASRTSSSDATRLGVAHAAVALLGDSSATRRSPASRRPSVRVRRAHRYIRAHLHDRALDPVAVADAQGVSRRWLDKAFLQTGMTVATAIQDARLREAARLLDDQRYSVLDVALLTGFPSGGSMSHAFRKRYGVRPSSGRRTGTEAGGR